MVGRAFKGHPPVQRFRRGVIYLLERPRENMTEWYLVKFIRLGKHRETKSWDGATRWRYEYHFLKLSGHEESQRAEGRIYTRIQKDTLNRSFRVRKVERNELPLYISEPNNTVHYDEELKAPVQVTTRRRQVVSRVRRYLATGDNRYHIKGLEADLSDGRI